MKSTPLSPQERSNLARQAAHARWSKVNVGQAVSLPPTSLICVTRPSKRSKLPKRSNAHSSWLDERFCLQLYQNPAGEWRLRTPAGIDLPATNAEISLWLDIESLRQQIASYESLIIG